MIFEKIRPVALPRCRADFFSAETANDFLPLLFAFDNQTERCFVWAEIFPKYRIIAAENHTHSHIHSFTH